MQRLRDAEDARLQPLTRTQSGLLRPGVRLLATAAAMGLTGAGVTAAAMALSTALGIPPAQTLLPNVLLGNLAAYVTGKLTWEATGRTAEQPALAVVRPAEIQRRIGGTVPPEGPGALPPSAHHRGGNWLARNGHRP